MRISDWSSDVCSSDLVNLGIQKISGNQGIIMADVFATQKSTAEKAVQLSGAAAKRVADLIKEEQTPGLMLRVTVSGGGCSGFQLGRASCRERVCQYV